MPILDPRRISFGTWNQIAAPEIIDLIGWNGFDYAIIDCEHGPFGLETAEKQGRACLASGLAPAVRAPSDEALFVGRALDAGLSTIVIPNMASAEAARRVVAATRYAPEGTRGACPCVRATGHFTTDWPAHVQRSAAETEVIALIETVEGVERAAEIAAVDGIAAVMAGPFDLSVSMGLSGDWRADAVQAGVERICAAADAAGKAIIMPVFSTDPHEFDAMIERWTARGVKSFVLGADKIIFADALARFAGRARTAAGR
ncbi:MAG: aldolase/citrate lyase family protein [Pseudomonadota bacterium]